MITSQIDGSQNDGSKQLFGLIDLISNPDGYTKKLKDLQDAADRNQKFVELVAPAEDILSLKGKILEDSKASAEALKDAKAQASKIVADAKDQAKALVSDAQDEADKLISEAKKTNSDSKAKNSDLANQISAAKNAKDASDRLAVDLNNQIAILASKQNDLDAALKAVKAEKQDLINKHKAFAESLV